MKKLYIFAVLAVVFLTATHLQAQTTVMAGDWSNPTTWGGAPPMGTGTVVINHAVNLDIDYMHTSGSVTINAAGSLSSSDPMRVFALNYPAGNATMTVNGSMTIARVPLAMGTVVVNGTMTIDSLLNSTDFVISNSGVINTEQFMNNTEGYIYNSGTINTQNFLNIDSVSNSGHITTNDLCNSKTFLSTVTAVIEVNHDFSNIDTLTGPAMFTNDGQVNIANNWHNGSTIDGTGKWCVAHNTWNDGTLSGTFDFCDQTGGNIDLEEGTVAGTITFCTYSCNVSIAEINNEIAVSPNPCSDNLMISVENGFSNGSLIIYNSFGQIVLQLENVSGTTVSVDSRDLSAGVYFITVKDDQSTFSRKFIKE
ncbi:hypothetical protein SDC9_73405 [bioreactor metagenome]|uniref:Secretion system C-terminal sorting domain-containing protein n=1 Tax=bioreactor metagenome TaxID=1076179 RepID=A0A644YEN6_9ZZZZ